MRALVLISFLPIHRTAQLMTSLETLLRYALVRHIGQILRIHDPRRKPSLHLGRFLHIPIYVHHMLHMLLHNMLGDLVMVVLRRVPYLLCLLELLLANSGVSRLKHLRGLLLLD